MCQVVLNFVVLTGKITDLKSKRFKNHQKFSGKNETLIDLLSERLNKRKKSRGIIEIIFNDSILQKN